ncbi:MAG: FAD:protein FMN transferase, partial [Acidimicrobiia bacterium]
PDSELSWVNRDPRKDVPLSELLGDVVSCAREARHLTDGLVDAGMGSSVIAWGYDRTFHELTGIPARPAGLTCTPGAWDIDAGILSRSPGTLMDLGGIGKGWACDRAVESGISIVASAGGDLRSAHPETTVPIVDPWGETVATVFVGAGALATSSVTKRRWRVGDGEAHHLIDPRSGSPTSGAILSASVISDSAAHAEAAAKAVVILGEEGLAWADRQSWIRSALVVWHDGSVFATSDMELVA